MKEEKVRTYIEDIVKNMPSGWLITTTHRLDIYNEEEAKTQFLVQFETLFHQNIYNKSALDALPTAYDYIRLGHPLSCVLEWALGRQADLPAENVISFESNTIPVLAILRKNLLEDRNTQINYVGALPDNFDSEKIKAVYGYHFELNQVNSPSDVGKFDGSSIFIETHASFESPKLNSHIDFYIQLQDRLGSVLYLNEQTTNEYVSDIQHVRRRETVAMTPYNSLIALKKLVGMSAKDDHTSDFEKNKKTVTDTIKTITGTSGKPLVGSSGLSIQYAIMMGLIDDAIEKHPGKAIKFIVPPNCYGGTNDQARRVAECLTNVEIIDLPVDGNNDMVRSIDRILDDMAKQDAIPYIIAEIPTNPRVEVPDMEALKTVLSKKRKTPEGRIAIDPVFILDQTFCPNIHFLGEGKMLSTVRTISYASGSKFPSGGRCTAGYCAANKKTETLMRTIEWHLSLCDNEATYYQYAILAEQLPSMNQRIKDAYLNTRKFVDFIQETLPSAKINFVSEDLANNDFTPSVFSLDLPTKGATEREKETYKRDLNLKLIHLMISEIPEESKFCVSYGQLKGVYWTVPATSTQGTTKEGDKDYIVRASLSPNMDLERHKDVFLEFVNAI